MKDIELENIAIANIYLLEIGQGHYLSMLKLYRYLLFINQQSESYTLRTYQNRIEQRISSVLNKFYTFLYYSCLVFIVLGFVLKKIFVFQFFTNPIYVVFTNFLFFIIVLPYLFTKKTFKDLLFIKIARRFPFISIISVKWNIYQ